MNDWRARLGSDSWRKLIAEECGVVESSAANLLKTSGKSISGLPQRIPAHTPNRSFCYLPLTPDGSPYKQCWLVFQTGLLNVWKGCWRRPV
jgi:hypothetical protein